MKNLIICLLFSCSFLMGSTAMASELGGTELILIFPKTGQALCSFELPKDYQPKNCMVEITVRQENGSVVYSKVSTGLIFNLPLTLEGTFYVTIEVDGFVSTKKITL